MPLLKDITQTEQNKLQQKSEHEIRRWELVRTDAAADIYLSQAWKKGFYPAVLQLSKCRIRIQSRIDVAEKMTELLSAKILLGVESVPI